MCQSFGRIERVLKLADEGCRWRGDVLGTDALGQFEHGDGQPAGAEGANKAGTLPHVGISGHLHTCQRGKELVFVLVGHVAHEVAVHFAPIHAGRSRDFLRGDQFVACLLHRGADVLGHFFGRVEPE